MTLRELRCVMVWVVGVLLSIPLFGLSQGTSFPTAWQSKAVPSAFSSSLRFATFPVLANGYLLSHARVVKTQDSPVVFLTSIASGEQRVFPLRIPGVTAVRIEHGAVTTSGRVLLVGSYSRSGQGAAVLHDFATTPGATGIYNFVARLDSIGALEQIFDLGDYTATRVCASADGSFWTVGEVWPEETRAGKPADYPILRHFNSSGTYLGGYVPRSSITRGGGVPNYRANVSNGRLPFLACSDQSVGAYLPRNPSGYTWVEVDLSTGSVTRQIVTNNPAGLLVDGLVAPSAGTIFASFIRGPKASLPEVDASPSSRGQILQMPGIYKLSLGAGKSNWQLVSGSPAGGTTLLGLDGASVVTIAATKSETRPGNSVAPVLSWRLLPAN